MSAAAPQGMPAALDPVAAASGVIVNSVGQNLSSAIPGEKFSLYINPTELPEN